MPAPTLPPRPNPGPEPWPGPDRFDPRWLGAAVPVVAAIAWWIARARRVAAVATPAEVGPEPSGPPDLVHLAERVREGLAARYGPAWIAKTTEEIAAATARSDDLGPEVREVLIGVLREADLAKFAARAEGRGQGPAGLAARVAEALAALAADGARSTQKGR